MGISRCVLYHRYIPCSEKMGLVWPTRQTSPGPTGPARILALDLDSHLRPGGARRPEPEGPHAPAVPLASRQRRPSGLGHRHVRVKFSVDACRHRERRLPAECEDRTLGRFPMFDSDFRDSDSDWARAEGPGGSPSSADIIAKPGYQETPFSGPRSNPSGLGPSPGPDPEDFTARRERP